MKNFALAIIMLSVLTSSCQKTIDPAPSGNLTEKTMLNVAYGSDNLQKMDIFLPAGRTDSTTKVMILIHGGSWSTGDKNDFTPYMDSLKKRLPGWAIFNLNYRLSSGSGTNIFPAQEMDIKTAYEFIYNKRSEYAISQKFVLLGASAGGHLALLQGYKYSTPVKPKAIVDFFGPTDMVDLYNNPASPQIPSIFLAAIVGATPASNATLYQQSSPINFVTAQSPPTIILHGGTDQLVSVSQSTSLQTKLQSVGVANQYIYYPTEGHGWFGANLSDSFDKISAFLAANVN